MTVKARSNADRLKAVKVGVDAIVEARKSLALAENAAVRAGLDPSAIISAGEGLLREQRNLIAARDRLEGPSS